MGGGWLEQIQHGVSEGPKGGKLGVLLVEFFYPGDELLDAGGTEAARPPQ